MSEIKNTIIYEGDNTGVTVELTEENIFIVKHGLKEMCPTEDKTSALIFAKGYERGLAEGSKITE